MLLQPAAGTGFRDSFNPGWLYEVNWILLSFPRRIPEPLTSTDSKYHHYPCCQRCRAATSPKTKMERFISLVLSIAVFSTMTARPADAVVSFFLCYDVTIRLIFCIILYYIVIYLYAITFFFERLCNVFNKVHDLVFVFIQFCSFVTHVSKYVFVAKSAPAATVNVKAAGFMTS